MKITRLLFVGLVLWAPLTHGAVIATIDFAYTWSRPIATGTLPSTLISVQFSHSLFPGGLDDPDTIVFDTLELGNGDSGRSFTIDSSDDPQFAAFVANVTDGEDDDIRVLVLGNQGGGVGSVTPESVSIQPLVSVTGPDLLGYTIDGLELFIEAVDINPLAAIGEINWTVRGELRFLASGITPIPIPGALLLFVSASLSLFVLRRSQTS